jgi:hypothetical protein
MSDRARPAVQRAHTASGATYHASSTRSVITRLRPGALSPGGLGVDIKHNSYDRYLNRIKGRGPLRRGVVPPGFGTPAGAAAVHAAYLAGGGGTTVQGNKLVKTAIGGNGGCVCPGAGAALRQREDSSRIYASLINAVQDQLLAVKYAYAVGDEVWARPGGGSGGGGAATWRKAVIVAIDAGGSGLYEVRFVADGQIGVTTYDGLLAWFRPAAVDACSAAAAATADCLSLSEQVLANQFSSYDAVMAIKAQNAIWCSILNLLTGTPVL